MVQSRSTTTCGTLMSHTRAPLRVTAAVIIIEEPVATVVVTEHTRTEISEGMTSSRAPLPAAWKTTKDRTARALCRQHRRGRPRGAPIIARGGKSRGNEGLRQSSGTGENNWKNNVSRGGVTQPSSTDEVKHRTDDNPNLLPEDAKQGMEKNCLLRSSRGKVAFSFVE